MSLGLIVTRMSGSDRRAGNPAITVSEWQQIVAQDGDLRLRVEPYVGVNPRTGEMIRTKAGEADAEIRLGAEWLPFLHFRNGELTGKWIREFDDPSNAVRIKIAAVARQLGAVIMTDSGDELLAW